MLVHITLRFVAIQVAAPFILSGRTGASYPAQSRITRRDFLRRDNGLVAIPHEIMNPVTALMEQGATKLHRCSCRQTRVPKLGCPTPNAAMQHAHVEFSFSTATLVGP